MKKSFGKKLFIVVMLFYIIWCGILMISQKFNLVAFADELECESCHEEHCHIQDESQKTEIGLEDYIDCDCNGVSIETTQANAHAERYKIEECSGYGCR